MEVFQRISLTNLPEIDRILRLENSCSADYSSGNLFLWDDFYDQRVLFCGDRLITVIHGTDPVCFAFPVGRGDLKDAIEKMFEYASEMGVPFIIEGVEERHKKMLQELYPDRFSFTPDRDHADYMYYSQSLLTYSGKSLHGKKNSCNRFEAEYSWHFEPITEDTIPLCRSFLGEWLDDNSERLGGGIEAEHFAINRAFDHFNELALDGGILFADNSIFGFSIGEKNSDCCFDVHFEKARHDVKGTYSMVCREMVKLVMKKYPEVKYINREDDTGSEALRTSKLSYCPEFLIDKYSARWIYD